MPIEPLEDLSDPRLDPFRQLKFIRREQAAKFFIAEGMLLLERLIASDFEIHSVVVIERLLPHVLPIVPSICQLYVIPDAGINTLVGFDFHRGVLACGVRRKPILLEEALAGEEPLTVLVLPQVQDPENLGSLLRLSAAFGVAGIVTGGGCPDPFSRRVLRVSMGGALRIPVWQVDDCVTFLGHSAANYNLKSVASVLAADATPLRQFRWPNRTALVLGREDQGLPTHIVQLCGAKITIPMHPGTDSLNVAVAAGIMLHAITNGEG